MLQDKTMFVQSYSPISHMSPTINTVQLGSMNDTHAPFSTHKNMLDGCCPSNFKDEGV